MQFTYVNYIYILHEYHLWYHAPFLGGFVTPWSVWYSHSVCLSARRVQRTAGGIRMTFVTGERGVTTIYGYKLFF
jgi:hypothetical protein